MGLLSKGTPLDWQSSKQHHTYIKQHGILQFLSIYHRMKDRSNDSFLWGDEVEAMLVTIDSSNARTATLSLRADEILTQLTTFMNDPNAKDVEWNATFLPEFGRFMIEATPAKPYGNTTADLRLVEHNMRLRRGMIQTLLNDDEYVTTLTSFPLLGVDTFTTPAYSIRGPVSDSDYVPDEIIGAHPRFATLTRNIRARRGRRIDIRVPLYQDTHTVAHISKLVEAQTKADQIRIENDAKHGITREPKPSVDETKEIHMDAMTFGMGCCCLQVTFQTRSIQEARHLYDHLAVFSPIMLALTGATPFMRGRIADTDVRWSTISQSVDDRCPAELGLETTDDPSVRRLYKSRYDSISTYLSLEKDFDAKYNDIPCEIHQPSYDTLLANGIDESLAKHIAHLFVRDPLVIYDESIVMDDEKSSDHFENIQSTNWQTVRFKPPPPTSPAGWRVEFRTMEVQLTDFENAAFTVFVALVSRALLYFNLNFYIPLSKVDENLQTAHVRDSVNVSKFYWRTNIQSNACNKNEQPNEGYELMTIKEIMLGKGNDGNAGLIPLVKTYLDMIQCDAKTKATVYEYLELIACRASGQLMTAATWLRTYVKQHPDYAHDSILTPSIVYDIVEISHQLASGMMDAPQLLGRFSTRRLDDDSNPSRQRSDSERTELTGAVLDLHDKFSCARIQEYLKVHTAEKHCSTCGDEEDKTKVETKPVHVHGKDCTSCGDHEAKSN